MAAVALGGMLAASHWLLAGHLLINFTASIPRGVYWISPKGRPQRGNLVAFPIPPSVRDLIYTRQYVPRTIRLLSKPVAAVGGDHVCIREHRLFVNDRLVGNVPEVDRQGRSLPLAIMCGSLRPGELFVATEHDNSFDSRNFGPIFADSVRGTLTPVVTF